MSRIQPGTELRLDGLSTEEAFSLLGNETRLEIIEALWQSDAMHLYDDVDESAVTVPYSDLQETVDMRDNGNFNYHLSELQPHFVTKTEDGYRLSGAGKQIARTVVAVSGSESDLETDLDVACPLCGGSVAASYDDSWLRFVCTECDGLFGDTAPEGTLLNENFPLAGVSSRDVASLYRTKLYRCVLDMLYLMQGVCRDCASPVESAVTVCEDHVSATDPCPTCGQHSQAWAELRCQTCRFGKRLPVEFCTLGLLPTLSFLYQNGINLFDPSLEQMIEMVEARFETTVTSDPLRVAVTIEGRDDELTITFDERLEFVVS